MIYNNVLKYLIFISLVSQKSDLLTKTHKYVSETKLLFIQFAKLPKYDEIYKTIELKKYMHMHSTSNRTHIQ